ncbi:MAG: hypothetical protein ACRDCY_07170, partial [Aeromonas veronii]
MPPHASSLPASTASLTRSQVLGFTALLILPLLMLATLPWQPNGMVCSIHPAMLEPASRRLIMTQAQIYIYGIDLGKNWFHLVAMD